VRLVSYRAADNERLGVVYDGRVFDAADLVRAGPRTMADLLRDGADTSELHDLAVDAHTSGKTAPRMLEDVELLAPVPRPGKIVAIGRNYHEHATEEGAAPPAEPLIFAKFSTSVVGHRHPVRWDPAFTKQVDYEAELAVVIGRRARRVSESDALGYVLGYTCGNDVSARDLQFGDQQWVRGKSLDTFCPLGPVLVTADEIPDPQVLRIRCLVNGEVLQDANTSDMVFPVTRLVAHASAAFTLEPGDVIMTGTPPGVGAFRKPQRFLRAGDEMTVEVERIGRLVNVCEEEPAPGS
jgi:2-keto-4-pentenoate hydratase/2-oxohepta-3-ene-1,7-dioic acid hydratase in catechol pathway